MEPLTLVRIALSVLTDRLITVFALSMSFALAAWVMYVPSWDRVVTFGIFVVFSYLVVQIKERSREKAQSAE